MPSLRALQSSPAFAVAAPGGALPSPTLITRIALSIPDMASGNVDFTGRTGQRLAILDFNVLKTSALGGAVNTIQLQKSDGTPITDALSINVADQTLVRAATLDDATYQQAAGAGLRVAVVKAGGNTECTAYLTGALLSGTPTAKVFQTSKSLTQYGAGQLRSPTLMSVLALQIPQGKGTSNWAGIQGFGFRVIDAWFVKTDAAGGAAGTWQIQRPDGVAVTDAVSLNIADTAIARATQIDDAGHEFSAGAGLRVVTAAAGAPDCRGILFVRIAHK